jgi:hypothetical protein
VIELVPHIAHTPIPKLMKILNEPFNDGIQIPGKLRDWFTPFVDLHLLKLHPYHPFGLDAYKGSRQQHLSFIQYPHARLDGKVQEV